MKILYVYREIPKKYGSYLTQLLFQIKKIFKIDTFVYKTNDSVDINYKTYGFKDSFHRVFYKLKLSKFKSLDLKIFDRYDIVHLQHSYLFNKVISIKKIKSSKSKIVITLRGGDTYLKPWVDNTWLTFYKNSFHFIDAFVVMTNHQKKYLIEKWNVKDCLIYVIPVSFGIRKKVKPKYPNIGQIKLMSAFRMTWEKNINECLLLAKKMKENRVNFIYDIYGNGKDISQLYFLVDKYGLKNHVNIMGFVSNEELNNLYRNYDFFIQLSLSESFGATVIEAQSNGVPCLVSNSGGLPETILNNITGFVTYEDKLEICVDKLLKLWKNRELYLEFSKEAIQNSNEKFSIESETEKLKTLYTKLYSS